MRCIAFTLLFIIGVTSIVAISVNGTQSIPTDADSDCCDATQRSNATARKGRHVAAAMQPSKKTKRQVIRIPGSVSKLKIVQPPLNLKQNRAPQQFSRFPPNFRSGGVVWRPQMRKSQTDHDFQTLPFDPKKTKRNPKKPTMREAIPEDFYNDETEPDFEEKYRAKKANKHRSVVKVKRKRPKHNIPGEFMTGYDQESPGVLFAEAQENRPFQGYDFAGSSIRLQQLAAPNFFQQNLPEASVETFAQMQMDDSYVPGLKVKKLPTKGRQVQSMFAQQYTTHNPHVTTNFGLNEGLQQNGVHYGNGVFPHLGKYSQPIAAASDQLVTSLSVNTPGIQVIQPPQFRDVTVSHPSHPSRLTSPQGQEPQRAQRPQRHQEEGSGLRATMRDILDQDCPSHDVAGYCDSPPRYPMQQIKNIVKICSELMSAMNTQPFEEPQETQIFSKRADNSLEKTNKSHLVDLGVDTQPSSWSRSATDGFSACNSEVKLIEPGYAKEVHSGKWFVIVQHPDTTIQRIATDTCRNPGKPCGGLSELKCVKINGLSGKSTRCVQRHTNQRLISWDPESPEDCPRMRVFRFPSACTCHLDVA